MEKIYKLIRKKLRKNKNIVISKNNIKCMCHENNKHEDIIVEDLKTKNLFMIENTFLITKMFIKNGMLTVEEYQSSDDECVDKLIELIYNKIGDHL